MNKRRREIVQFLHNSVSADVLAKQRPHEAPPPGLAVRNEGSTRELMIYGRIGGGGWFDEGISASDVARALRELGPGPIDVRINSGGGDVFDGVAIHTQLARHSGAVTVYVDGLAASAASFIAMAGDNIVMARGGFMMIHDGMTMTYGNPKTHRSNADLLDKISDSIADTYAERAGEDAAHWRGLMSENGEDGTWYTGEEALAAGLVDELSTGRDVEDKLQGWSNVLPEKLRPSMEDVEEEQKEKEEEFPPPADTPSEETSEEQENTEQDSAPALSAEVDDSEREWAWVATALAAGSR